jgi:hypothetical protein
MYKWRFTCVGIACVLQSLPTVPTDHRIGAKMFDPCIVKLKWIRSVGCMGTSRPWEESKARQRRQWRRRHRTVHVRPVGRLAHTAINHELLSRGRRGRGSQRERLTNPAGHGRASAVGVHGGEVHERAHDRGPPWREEVGRAPLSRAHAAARTCYPCAALLG